MGTKLGCIGGLDPDPEPDADPDSNSSKWKSH